MVVLSSFNFSITFCERDVYVFGKLTTAGHFSGKIALWNCQQGFSCAVKDNCHIVKAKLKKATSKWFGNGPEGLWNFGSANKQTQGFDHPISS